MNVAKVQIQNEFNELKRALSQFPEGASLEELKSVLTSLSADRTLQRRLESLKHSGLIITTGNKRSTRYHPVIMNQVLNDSGSAQEYKLLPPIPVSTEGQKIRTYVTQPIQHRKPDTYHRKFLDVYVPNETSYLTKSEMKRLALIGQVTGQIERGGTYSRDIMQRLLIDLSWNSSRLEGNTYSFLDTERLITQGEPAANNSAMEAQMILNHKDAIEFIMHTGEDIGLNGYTVLNLHGLLSANLLTDSSASGRLRKRPVTIGGTPYIPLAVPQLIEELFEQILEKAIAINDPFEQAFFVMVHIPYLQPFEDVNKRVSRLAANIPLSRNHLSPLSFIDVPEELYVKGLLGVYELNRVELLKDVFVWAYERSAARYSTVRQSLGEPDPFRLKYREQLRDIIGNLVNNIIAPRKAKEQINTAAANLPFAERKKFIETVEKELKNLHEGNIARYRVRPSVFRKWKDVWKS